MEKNRSNWNVGDTCVLIVSIPKRYTQEFEVKGFDGKYYTLKHGNSIHHSAPGRISEQKKMHLMKENIRRKKDIAVKTP